MSNQSSFSTHVRSTWKFFKFLLLVHCLNGFAFATSSVDSHPQVYKPIRSGRPAIGISIGNSWSSIGLKNSLSEPKEIGTLIPNKNGRQSIPSVVSFTENGTVMVGEEAVETLLKHPEHSVTGFMRLLGKNFSEVTDFVDAAGYRIVGLENDQLAIEMWAGETRMLYSAIEVTALMIKELKNMAEEYIGKEINETAMSIPASYGDREREAMKNAAKIAGLEIGSPVSESTLASLLYQVESSRYLKDDLLYLVYNFDGASFEANVLDVEDSGFWKLSAVRFEPVGSKGYEQDWYHLRNFYQDEQYLRNEQTVESFVPANRAYQKPLVVGAGGDDSTRKTETVESFNINELFKVIDQAIHDANRTIYDFDGIVTFGETNQMHKLQSLIKDRYRFTVPIYDYMDPKAVLALGAATQAWYRRENVWRGCAYPIEICGSRLGVETAGGIMTTIIKRGTAIPTRKTQIFTTTVDNQTSVTVNMFAGERSFVAHNKKFGSLELSDLKTLPRGEPKIEIAFEIWEKYRPRDNELKVIITELGTNNTNSTTFRESQYHDDEFLERQLEEEWDTREEQIHLEMVQREIKEGGVAHQGAEPNQIIVSDQPPTDEELQQGKFQQWWQWLQHPWVGVMYLW